MSDVLAKCDVCGEYRIPIEDGGCWCFTCRECLDKEFLDKESTRD